jgi:ABC-type transporter Mla MlaB component
LQLLSIGTRIAIYAPWFEASEACVLRIQRSTNDSVVLKLSGRIEAEDVSELRRLLELEKAGHRVILDLEDVTLVDRVGVVFLAQCRAEGISLEHCPAYVREWLQKEREHAAPRKP